MMSSVQRQKLNQINAQNQAAKRKFFDDLCQAARNLDELAIFKLFFPEKVKIDINEVAMITLDIPTVAMVMAMEGRDDAVSMLLNTFKANPGRAIAGYARKKNVDKVNQLLSLEGNAKYINDALQGYAFAGETTEVNKLLTQPGASMCFPAYGYACAGNYDELKNLFSREDCTTKSFHLAIEGAAHSGLFDLVEKIILDGTKLLDAKEVATASSASTKHLPDIIKKKHDNFSELCAFARDAFNGIDFFNDSRQTIKLLASLKDGKIFKNFCEFVASKEIHMANMENTKDEIIEIASCLRHKMLTEKISYDEALAAGLPEKKSSAARKLYLTHFHHHFSGKSSHMVGSRANKKSAEEPAPTAPTPGIINNNNL